MSKKAIIEKNCVRTCCALFSYFVSVLDFQFKMGKDQAGKNHNYPLYRKPYSSGRKGIGGRKKKNDRAATSNMLYFLHKRINYDEKNFFL